MPEPSGVRLLKPNLLLGLREGGLVTLLILTPKFAALVVVDSVTTTVFPLTVQGNAAPVRSLHTELLLGEISEGNMTSRKDEAENAEGCARVNVYSVIALLTVEAALTLALIKPAGTVILMLMPALTCSMRYPVAE